MNTTRHTLLQRFHQIISLASLAYTFTTLHTIEYSMQDHNYNNNTAQTQQDHNSTNLSAFTHDTPPTTGTSETIKKSTGSSQWTENEIKLLLDYVKENCTLMTAQCLNLKKLEFNKAHEIVKLKDVSQCYYKWSHVCIILINKIFHNLCRFSLF